ncbi:unnamed protein product [Commensalibacter communis]|uniref:hypothetical protein n=1 Tax=Commensalibacter communis TaxID=2972786 RepID=UPI0022FFC16C|nr:hypothetical protein [Commensalibacter communis]CAI3929241.1 unnamed protein product [Commensalibacter communis]CAI3930008.1 unnamed protein product [Commensalibacter communis]
MVFQWFKKKGQKGSTQNHSQRLLVLPMLQTGQQIDFIYKVENQAVQYIFDLSLVLQPNEVIEEVNYENKEDSFQLKDFIYQQNKFTVTADGGWNNSKFAILLKVTTNTKQIYHFTILVTIISVYKNKNDLGNGQRVCRLWGLDHNPDLNYAQENQEPWIEGDMILNIHNRYLWEYKKTDKQEVWLPLFILNGATDSVVSSYSDAKNPGERLALNHIHSDQGKVKSDSKGNLSVQGDMTTGSIYTKAIIAGHPLGEGMLFTSQGMIAGHSLYIGSPEAKPKNIYIGMPGVVSTKMVSTDYLQLTPLSVKELPSQVTKGTLILCYDYKGHSDLVLLYAKKDTPQTLSDWKVLFASTGIEQKPTPPTSSYTPRIAPTSKPHLYPVSFNPDIPTGRSKLNNIIDIKPVPNTDNTNEQELVKTQTTSCSGIGTYTRFQFEKITIPKTIDKKIVWKKLCVEDQDQQLKGEGQQYWSKQESCWQVPVEGLLHVEGSFIFIEEQLNSSEPIPYHTGDMLLLNVACNQEQKHEIYPTTQLEFPLIPYVNDVTHRICAHQQISFSMTYPVKKGDKISIILGYLNQHSAYSVAKDLCVKKSIITLYMS